MKNLVLTLLLGTLLPTLSIAGNSVTFVINDLAKEVNDEQVLVYPEGTAYKVMQQSGELLSPTEREGGALTFAPGKFKLMVYPSYRPEQADEFTLVNKQLRVFETPWDAKRMGYAKNWKEGKIILNHDDGTQYISRPYAVERTYSNNELLQKKVVAASDERPGRYNLKLYFKNGLQFHYIDGQARAELDGEPQIVEGAYIVHTDLGTAKISFNPENGDTWWVFTKESGKSAE